jgi:hypothetical protein
MCARKTTLTRTSVATGECHEGCSKRLFSKAAVSEAARRYAPHFVGPFAPRMDLGERISPSSVSGFRKTLVEPLSDARTPLADFFSILLIASPDEQVVGS